PAAEALAGRQVMNPAGVTVRPMTAADAAPVLAIYQAGLDGGEASFETQAPAWEVFDATRLPGHRHVAVDDASGEVLGWAAACPDGCGQAPCMLSCMAPTAAPSGVKSLICSRLAGIWARGIHKPAKNISGKNSMVPITPAVRPVGATAAISIPRPSIAAAA